MGASTRKMAAMRTKMGIMMGTWEEKRGTSLSSGFYFTI